MDIKMFEQVRGQYLRVPILWNDMQKHHKNCDSLSNLHIHHAIKVNIMNLYMLNHFALTNDQYK